LPPCHLVILAVLCGLLFFLGIDAGDLYQTEGLRARVADECLGNGDWLVPTLHGEPLLTKPPGAYVAIALASWLSGAVTPVSARLPSALAATLVVCLFYRTFRRSLGPQAGLTAAVLLPASFSWLGRVPSAEIDMLQLTWVAAALLAFLRALEVCETDAPAWRRWAWWQVALLCVAGGFLTKWTAPAFFYLTVVPLLWWRGRLRLLARPAHLASVMLASLPCLAWATVVASRVGWDVLWGTVRQEALQHLSPLHHGRPYPWHEVALFPLGLLAACLPWSACALWTLRPGFGRMWDERGRRLLQFLHCWAWPNLLFWSLVPGHHIRHGLPLQPALAGLAALVWTAWLGQRLPWPWPRLRPGSVLLGLLLIWLAVKVVFVWYVVPARTADHQPSARGRAISSLVPPGRTLYLSRVKDEGILFYCGRPARRLADLASLPPSTDHYCLLTEAEWRDWASSRPGEVLLRLPDEQGAPLVLFRTAGREKMSNPGGHWPIIGTR
jgi:4-amino-4-deoxy-L-arabinose transferase-like glycosyltransferase